MTYFKPTDVFVLSSGTMTRDQLIALLQTVVAAIEATSTAYQAWQETVQSEHATELSVRPVRADVKNNLVSRYGKNSKQLLKFGFGPAKQPEKTTATKSTAVAKAQATREARGTKGSKQKRPSRATSRAWSSRR
jgi:hypothetical protein